jgi:hypothetical protein
MLEWLATTRWSVALHESVYVWPLLESIHVLCLTLFVGTTAMLDLRLAGAAMTRIPASAFTQRLLPWTRAAFAIMVTTGVLLFTATPVTYYHSTFFRIKLALLAAAGVNVWFFHARTRRRIADWDSAAVPPAAARTAAIVSLAVWTGVVVAGRLVAYEDSPTHLVARISPWLFPAIESAHLVGLCALGGTVLVVDLRMLGFGLTNQSVRSLAAAVHPWLEASLVLMVCTGALLFASETQRVLHTPPFWVKMGTLPVAILYTFTVRKRVAQSGTDTSPLTRRTAIVSLLLWFTVAAAGRWIGFSSCIAEGAPARDRPEITPAAVVRVTRTALEGVVLRGPTGRPMVPASV